MVLGVPVAVWFPAVWLFLWLQGIAHADLAWGYGGLGRVLVSPRFHRLHHSAEARHQGLNYGVTFSLWDYLFGTARDEAERPAAFGTPDIPVPDSFLQQLVFPFTLLARRSPSA